MSPISYHRREALRARRDEETARPYSAGSADVWGRVARRHERLAISWALLYASAVLGVAMVLQAALS